jgi:hypothetical protein
MLSENENECSICLDNINKNEIHITKCNHYFHKKCWLTYISYNKFKNIILCPFCNTLLLSNNFQRDDVVILINSDFNNNNLLNKKNKKIIGILTICGVIFCGYITLFNN